MPEIPDICLYQHALNRFIVGRTIDALTVRSPFLVRTFEPEISAVVGHDVVGIRRMGKRIVWELDGDLFLVFHLMIAGRFHWKKPGVGPTRKVDLAAFGFDHGTLMLTEAASKKRAALYVHADEASLAQHDRGGLEVLDCSLSDFQSMRTTRPIRTHSQLSNWIQR
jgi:formamidopyrimidine-DNA glycosylase